MFAHVASQQGFDSTHYRRSIVEYICAQPAPAFTTGGWARSLSQERLDALSRDVAGALRGTDHLLREECIELVQVILAAERFPRVVVSGHLDPTVQREEAMSAMASLNLLILAEVGRRMGIVHDYAASIFMVSKRTLQVNSSRVLDQLVERSAALVH